MPSRRNFLRTLIGVAIAAPLGAFAGRDAYTWIRSLNLADFGGLIPQREYLAIRLLDVTADNARALAERCLWEANLARQMMEMHLDERLAAAGISRAERRRLFDRVPDAEARGYASAMAKASEDVWLP